MAIAMRTPKPVGSNEKSEYAMALNSAALNRAIGSQLRLSMRHARLASSLFMLAGRRFLQRSSLDDRERNIRETKAH
jgi:hypothetical protein